MKSYASDAPWGARAAASERVEVVRAAAAEKKGQAPRRPPARRNPIAVRAGYPRHKELVRDLTRYESECFTSSAARKYTGDRLTRYCIATAWARVKKTGRFADYFKETPMTKADRRKIALKNLAKAHAANRRKSGKRPAKKKHHARAAEKLPGGRVRVKSHTVHQKKKNIPTKGYTRHVSKPTYRRDTYTYKQTPKQRAASKRNLKLARMAKGGSKSSSRRSGARDNPVAGAFENPPSGGEYAMIGGVGLVAFLVSSVVDRVVATHAVTPHMSDGKTQDKDANGNLLYDDAPAQGQVYNIIAIDAPMDLKRWLVGGAFVLVPAIGAAVAHSSDMPNLTVVMVSATFGAGFRLFGKAASDGLAYLFRKTAFGQRALAPEINAASFAKQMKAQGAAKPGVTGAIPAGVSGVGVGAPYIIGAGAAKPCCDKCAQGQPCAKNAAPPGEQQRRPAPPPPPKGVGKPQEQAAPQQAAPQRQEEAPRATSVPNPFGWAREARKDVDNQFRPHLN